MKVCSIHWIILALTCLSFVMMVQLHKLNDGDIAIGGRVSNIKIPLGSINPVMVYHARKSNYDTNNNNNNTSLNESYSDNEDDINFDALLNKNNNDIISNDSEFIQNEFLFETPY